MAEVFFEDHYGVEQYGVPVGQNALCDWTGPDLMTPVRHQRYTRTCLCLAITDCISAILKLQMREFDSRDRGGRAGAGQRGGHVGGRGGRARGRGRHLVAGRGVGGGAAPIPPTVFSAQELYDCVPRDGATNNVNLGRCVAYIQQHGVHTLLNYNFNDVPGRSNCRVLNGKRKISFDRWNELHGEEAVLRALNTHPILATTRHAGLQYVFFHSDPTAVYGVGEVYDPVDDSGHCVLVVGYGRDVSGSLYYIIKSHWGRSYGHLGYLRVDAGLLRRFLELDGVYWKEPNPED